MSLAVSLTGAFVDSTPLRGSPAFRPLWLGAGIPGLRRFATPTKAAAE